MTFRAWYSYKQSQMCPSVFWFDVEGNVVEATSITDVDKQPTGSFDDYIDKGVVVKFSHSNQQTSSAREVCRCSFAAV